MDYRLFVCDLDNTLLKGSCQSSWQMIWDFLGIDDELRRHGWQQYMSGVFSYPDWCAHDARTFRAHGLRRDHFTEICRGFRPAPGLRETLEALKQRGVRLAIVSGALDRILHTALPWHGEFFDQAFVNTAQFDEDGLICGILPTPYDFEGKLRCVEELCAEHEITAAQAVFVGDGINDLSLAGKVGLTIAFGSDCEPVRDAFDLDLPDDDFRRILEYL